MIPTITLPRGVSVLHVTDACRDALTQFEELEPNHFALAHWVCTAYRAALVGARAANPLALGVMGPVEAAIREAKERLVVIRNLARDPSVDLVARLPPKVHIARVRDEGGELGFGPLDVHGTPLAARVLSLFFAEYLTRPERYVEPTAA